MQALWLELACWIGHESAVRLWQKQRPSMRCLVSENGRNGTTMGG